MELTKQIEETEYSKTELEEIVKICQNKIWKIDRENRIKELERKIKQLKTEIAFPESINVSELEEQDFDYTNR